jgi:outer membrane protein TolC
VFTGGRVAAGVSAASSLVEAAEDWRAHADVELSARVAHDYDDVLLARALLDVAEAAVTTLDWAAVIARERYDAGAAAGVEVLRAETRLAAARADVRGARAAIENATDRLAAGIGVAPERLPGPSGLLEPADLDGDTLSPDALVRAPRAARPDLRALAATAGAARAKGRAARGALRPSASVYVATLAMRPELLSEDGGWGTELFGGLLLRWSPLDFGAARGEERSAEAEALGLEAQAAQQADAAAASVRAQLRELHRARIDIDETRETIGRAERALAISREWYTEGAGIQLEVLEAEADLTGARAELARAIHAHRSAAIELRRALGLPADASLRDRPMREEER